MSGIIIGGLLVAMWGLVIGASIYMEFSDGTEEGIQNGYSNEPVPDGKVLRKPEA